MGKSGHSRVDLDKRLLIGAWRLGSGRSAQPAEPEVPGPVQSPRTRARLQAKAAALAADLAAGRAWIPPDVDGGPG